MYNSLTFTEVTNVIFHGIKIAFAFGAIFSDVFGEIYNDFILQL